MTRKKSPNVYKRRLKMISLEKWWILTPLQNFPKNVGDLENLLPKALKSCPKSNKLPNLVTLTTTYDLGRYCFSSPSTKELHDMENYLERSSLPITECLSNVQTKYQQMYISVTINWCTSSTESSPRPMSTRYLIGCFVLLRPIWYS